MIHDIIIYLAGYVMGAITVAGLARQARRLASASPVPQDETR